MDAATVSISGSGNVRLRGDASQCDGQTVSLRIGGSGGADLRGCRFASAEVRISGSGDAAFTLGTGDFNGSISGSGSIRYRGSPTRVDVRTSGSGRLIKEGNADAEVGGADLPVVIGTARGYISALSGSSGNRERPS